MPKIAAARSCFVFQGSTRDELFCFHLGFPTPMQYMIYATYVQLIAQGAERFCFCALLLPHPECRHVVKGFVSEVAGIGFDWRIMMD